MENAGKNWIELFKGLMQDAIPIGGGGYIFNAHPHPKHNYAYFEIIGFDNVKQIITSEKSVTFQSEGFKIFVVFESRNYPTRYMEPYLRPEGEQIPMRWNELDIVELPARDRIFVSREPYRSHGSFTVEAPETGSFVYYFYNNQSMDKNVLTFLRDILKEDFRVPKKTIEEVLIHVLRNIEVFHRETAEYQPPAAQAG